MNAKPKIAGIGETLWDMFPDGGRLGGAPTNFACHCRQLGGDAYPVSCVGDDELGRQTRLELNQLSVDDDSLDASIPERTSEHVTNSNYVEILAGRATGQVNITLDSDRKPTFDIQTDAAWDYLEFTPELKELAGKLDAVCFGTLAQRSIQTRETIQSFVRSMPEESLKILDINLRAPFYSKALIENSLKLATVLKLSDDELVVLANYFNLQGTCYEQLSTLLNRFDLNLIAFTRGSEGSVLLDRNQFDECPATPVEVVDSVGAGDSFTAALCVGLLQQWPLYEVNSFASRVASYVCSRYGATPILPSFISKTAVS